MLRFLLGVAIFELFVAVSFATAQTQIELDGSLPNGRTDDLVATQPGPVYTIDQTMGEATGDNLTHSLLLLSVGPGDTAQFTAVDAFDNVVVRVTGGQESVFNGTLRSTVTDTVGDGADLFLLNPAGVVFATNSRIDVPGSLYLSTAHYLQFDDGAILDLLDASNPVLTTADPLAFGFLGGAPAADIRFVENAQGGFLTLSVPRGETLGVAAGGVQLGGSAGSLFLQAPGGQVKLAAMGSAAGTVPIDGFDPATSDPASLGTVTLGSGAVLTTLDLASPGGPQGSIVIRGGALVLDGGSASAGGDPSADLASIDVDVSDHITASNGGVLIASGLGTRGSGDVLLTAGNEIRLMGSGSGALSQLASSGPGGDVILGAPLIVVDDSAQVAATVEAFGANPIGPGGDVVLMADDVRVTNGAQVRVASDTAGPAGDLLIQAGRLEVSDGQIATRGSVDAAPGGIRLEVDELSVEGATGAITSVNTSTLAAGGDIVVVDASVGVQVVGGGLIASESSGTQAGGIIDIATADLLIADGGRIQTSATSDGASGAIVIDADTLEISNGAGTTPGLLGSFVAAGAFGDGGSIDLGVGSLLLADGGQVSTTTDGGVVGLPGGDAGDITIVATGDVVLTGSDGGSNPSGIFARSNPGAGGASGAVTIDAASIRVQGGAEISTRAFGDAASGDIVLTALDEIEVSGFGNTGSVVSARGINGGGGNVSLDASYVEVAGGGSVDVSTSGSGPGGVLSIRGGELVVAGTSPDGSLPSALAAEATGSGTAGGIDVDMTGSVQIDSGAEVTAVSTGAGGAGDILIGGQQVQVLSGAKVAALATGSSDAGSITIQADEGFTADQAEISTESVAAFGGNIAISAGDQLLASNSSITTSVQVGTGNGGDIDLQSQLLYVRSSDVIARAFAGNGGNINIDSANILITADSVVDASSMLGLDGEIIRASPEADMAGQTAPATVEYLDAAGLLSRACGERTERAGSFVVRDHGSWEPPPDGPLLERAPRSGGCLDP